MDLFNKMDNETFLLFLKNQVKGVFNNDCYCIHNSLLANSCIKCIKDFIKHSNYKEYFFKLCDWFTEEVLFAHDIVNCFKSIHHYLTYEQVTYFCSSWLDGIYSVININTLDTEISITEISMFETLCLQGHLETLKWLYE